MATRPTSEVSDVILDSLDRMFEQLIDRLSGLTTAEYLWEPVERMWSVRDTDGSFHVDVLENRDAEPAPVTTIAWRLWHIASDCLESYTRRLRREEDLIDASWTSDPDEAIDRLKDAWSSYRGEVAGRDWWDLLGEGWGPFEQHSVADMAMHASNELVHHGGEIALLRDLYRAGLNR